MAWLVFCRETEADGGVGFYSVSGNYVTERILKVALSKVCDCLLLLYEFEMCQRRKTTCK